jgi:phosphomevalonate kinase
MASLIAWTLKAGREPCQPFAYAFTGESASKRVLINQVEARKDEAARQGGDFRAFTEAVTA